MNEIPAAKTVRIHGRSTSTLPATRVLFACKKKFMQVEAGTELRGPQLNHKKPTHTAHAF